MNIKDSGRVIVSNSTKLWFTGTVNLNGGILDTGTLDLTEGTFNMLGGLLHAKIIDGDINYQAGTISPGRRPGILTVTGDYTQGAAATLQIELGGTIQGDEYDVLVANGNLTLDGNLNVLPIGGFEPQAGDTFDILDFASANLSGTFSAVNLPSLTSGLTWDNSDLLTAGQLRVLEILLGGDANADGDRHARECNGYHDR